MIECKRNKLCSLRHLRLRLNARLDLLSSVVENLDHLLHVAACQHRTFDPLATERVRNPAAEHGSSESRRSASASSAPESLSDLSCDQTTVGRSSAVISCGIATDAPPPRVLLSTNTPKDHPNGVLITRLPAAPINGGQFQMTASGISSDAGGRRTYPTGFRTNPSGFSGSCLLDGHSGLVEGNIAFVIAPCSVT